MCKENINQLPLSCPQLGTWAPTQARALTGNRTGGVLVPMTMPNPPRHSSQGCLSLTLGAELDF